MSINAESYVTLYGWMVHDLKLKGNQLTVYALVFGFTQTNGWFKGTARYISEWTGTSKQTVYDCLDKLVKKQLLEKEERMENGVKLCDYRTKSLTGVVKKFDAPYQKINLPGCQKIGVHNTISDITKESDKDIVLADKPQRTHFVPPDVEQVSEYCKSRQNNVDVQRFVEYYTANGWKVGRNTMKDWKAAVRYWENGHRDKKTDQAKHSTGGLTEEDLIKAGCTFL